MGSEFKWDAEHKWDMYAETAEKIAEEHSCEEVFATLSDLASELAQYAVRKAVNGTLYKDGSTIDLMTYMTKLTVFLMAASYKVDSPELYDHIEKDVVSHYYMKYADK